MTKQSKVFGAGGGSNSFPKFPLADAAALMGGVGPRARNWVRIPGFVGDGDSIGLPFSGNDTILYANSAGTVQWQYAPSDFDVAYGKFLGFQKIGGLLYVGVVGNVAKVLRFYTVDIAGTKTALGPEITHATSITYNWNTQVTAAGACLCYFNVADNEVVLDAMFAASNFIRGTYNYVTGAIVETNVTVSTIQNVCSMPQSPDGYYVSYNGSQLNVMHTDYPNGSQTLVQEGELVIGGTGTYIFKDGPELLPMYGTWDKFVFVDDYVWYTNIGTTQPLELAGRCWHIDDWGASLKEIFTQVTGTPA